MRRVPEATRVLAGVLAVALLAASCVTYVPMEEGETVRVERRFASRAYFQTDDDVEPNSIADVLEKDYTTARYARLYRSRMTAYGIVGLVGSLFMVGGAITSAIFIDEPFAGLGLVGTGLVLHAVALPFFGSAHRALAEGVEVYNEALLSP